MLDIFIYILHYVHPKSYIELPVRSQKGLNPSFCLWLITFESGPNLLQLSICSIDAASCFGCFSVFTDQFSLARALSTAIRPSFPVGHAMKSSHLDWLVAIVELTTKKVSVSSDRLSGFLHEPIQARKIRLENACTVFGPSYITTHTTLVIMLGIFSKCFA